jgi:uncharacterized protein GlcG (DUF336 family)
MVVNDIRNIGIGVSGMAGDQDGVIATTGVAALK